MLFAHLLLLCDRDSVGYIYNNLVSLLNNPRNENYCSENCNGTMFLFLLLFEITWSIIIHSFSDMVHWIGIKRTFLMHYPPRLSNINCLHNKH